MSRTKEAFVLKFFGSQALEFVYIDTWLRDFADGCPKTNINFSSDRTAFTLERVTELLLSRGYLRKYGADGFIITSDGLMHLAKGGFVGEIIRYRTDRFAFWFSLAATIISIGAFFLAFR